MIKKINNSDLNTIAGGGYGEYYCCCIRVMNLQYPLEKHELNNYINDACNRATPSLELGGIIGTDFSISAEVNSDHLSADNCASCAAKGYRHAAAYDPYNPGWTIIW
jgi:hypothetical protein